MTRIQLLGSQLDCLTMEETLLRIHELIAAKIPTQHVVINASKINLMAQDKHLAAIINQCPLINADGQSIVWAGRFLGHAIPERVTGIDLFTRLVAEAAKKKYRIFYFGATEEVLEKVIRLHQQQYPELQIAGYRNGYFSESEENDIAEEIRASQADILFVGFSSPKKEQWIHRHNPLMRVPFVMGVGGSFDILAGKTKRAPHWMQEMGLEWFFRLIQEPKRMYRRYLKGNLIFLHRVLKEKIQSSK